MLSSLDQLVFNTAQAVRISWFFGQKLLASRVTRPVPLPERLRGRPMPDTRRILRDLWGLVEQDWRNIEAGCYLPPMDEPDGPLEAFRHLVDFFADLSAVERRRHGPSEGSRLHAAPNGGYPAYYLQNFHFQSDGYLSGPSAGRYDHQVEVLFGGAAAAMRRQALVPLKPALAPGGTGQVLDVACGTAGFLREVKANHPRLRVFGLDLSPHYLAVARRRLQHWSRVCFIQGMAEAMPFADGQFDAVSCIYLFHELPPDVRRAVVEEVRRVLRPGGRLIFVDSLQTGDNPDYDGMLEYFPLAFYEPYYATYLKEDLDRLWSPGFTLESRLPAYFSKVLSYRRSP